MANQFIAVARVFVSRDIYRRNMKVQAIKLSIDIFLVLNSQSSKPQPRSKVASCLKLCKFNRTKRSIHRIRQSRQILDKSILDTDKQTVVGLLGIMEPGCEHRVDSARTPIDSARTPAVHITLQVAPKTLPVAQRCDIVPSGWIFVLHSVKSARHCRSCRSYRYATDQTTMETF